MSSSLSACLYLLSTISAFAVRRGAPPPGFGTSLAQVTLTAEQPFGVRQLAGVILKNFIKQHWQEGTRHFVAPEVRLGLAAPLCRRHSRRESERRRTSRTQTLQLQLCTHRVGLLALLARRVWDSTSAHLNC
jgi:hypothetical protein